jgi:hypothetical protein
VRPKRAVRAPLPGVNRELARDHLQYRGLVCHERYPSIFRAFFLVAFIISLRWL